MPLSAPADIGLADRVHLDGGLHARIHARPLERVLHGKRVHDRRQHAHIVGRPALHALGRAGQAAEDVAAANDDAQFNPGFVNRSDFFRHSLDGRHVQANALLAHQDLAGDLQQDAPVVRRRFGRCSGHGCLVF